MSALPPVLVGSDHDKVTSFVPPIPVSDPGAAGAVNGVPETVELNKPLPAAFVAETRTAYPVPLVKPVSSVDVVVTVDAAANVAPPSVEISTTYPVIALPLFEPGAVHETFSSESPPVTVSPVGALGIPNGTTFTLDDAVPAPEEMIPDTRKL